MPLEDKQPQPTLLDLAMRRVEEDAILFEMEQVQAEEEARREHNEKIRTLMRRVGRAR